MYVENPKKRMKNHGFLLCSALYYMERRGNSYTIRVFFFQKETLFSTFLSYQLSTLFSKHLLGFLPSNSSCMFLL